jgi:tetratricopeptide (TPR) repeat protein
MEQTKRGGILFNVFIIFIIQAGCAQAMAHGTVGNRMADVNHALEHDPEDARLYMERGRIHQEKQRWDEALADYGRAQLLDKNLHEVVYWTGMLWFERLEYPVAEQLLQKYVSLSDSPRGHTALGELYAQTGKPEMSAHHYDIAIKLDSTPSPGLYLQRARALMQAHPLSPSIGHLNGIVAGIDEGIARHGELATYLELLIELYDRNGEYRRALDTIARLPASLQTTPAWQLSKADLLFKSGDNKSATASYLAAIRAVEQLPEHRRNVKANVVVKQEARFALDRLESKLR